MTTARGTTKQLTLAELDEGSRKLGTNLVGAMGDDRSVDQFQALAITAWLVARRDDPKAKLETFRQMLPDEVTDALGVDTVDEEDTDPAADPTAPAPAS